jgi:hypothetical protein
MANEEEEERLPLRKSFLNNAILIKVLIYKYFPDKTFAAVAVAAAVAAVVVWSGGKS